MYCCSMAAVSICHCMYQHLSLYVTASAVVYVTAHEGCLNDMRLHSIEIVTEGEWCHIRAILLLLLIKRLLCEQACISAGGL